ncbi:MAG: DJ-1/PfpI family protein [Breznakibacter sp.]
MSKKVFVFLAPGFEEVEAITPIDVLRRAGLDVTTVSITDDRKVVGSHHIEVVSDVLLSEIDLGRADVLLLPGGMPGTNNLNACGVLKAALVEHSAKNKLVAAICAAPLVLGELGLLDGHTATCYPGHEPRLKGANVTSNQVEVSLPFVTGRGAGASMEFSLTLVTLLAGSKTAGELAAKMMVLR